MSQRGVIVLSGHWHDRRNELAFVIRSIAGAATRFLAPSRSSFRARPGGANQTVRSTLCTSETATHCSGPTGSPPSARSWSTRSPRSSRRCSSRVAPGTVLYLSASGDGLDPAWRRLHLVGDEPSCSVNVYVPVNPLARCTGITASASPATSSCSRTGRGLTMSRRRRPPGSPPPSATPTSSSSRTPSRQPGRDGHSGGASRWTPAWTCGACWPMPTCASTWPRAPSSPVSASRHSASGHPSSCPRARSPARCTLGRAGRDLPRRARSHRGGRHVPGHGQPVGCLRCRSVLCRRPLRRCGGTRRTCQGASGRRLIGFSCFGCR